MSERDDPSHIAVIMDGNGRWARQRRKARIEGHRAGVRASHGIVEACARRGIGALTLFAFSSENWRRPASEVSLLMDLFLRSLREEVGRLEENGIRLQFIGDRAGLGAALHEEIDRSEARTADNNRLVLNIAANYGGRSDIVAATRRLATAVAEGHLQADSIDAELLGREVALGDQPEPDLFIRTGGEHRLSNYLLWQLAYTELWFTDTLWPDFDDAALDEAIAFYRNRERRFGRTNDQIQRTSHA